uniref:uncharacterized protein LOC122597088 n=1 Tax=Erigeron canadensis TaxID=72917 RepID=UPI001CB99D8F|nr:uncharacterized protein LOC122597088 [Erigeron canadensis]
MARFPEWPPSNSMDVETLSLKKLVLLSVNISEPALSALLKHSSSLEKLYIVGSGLLTAVNVGGFHINLKQLILMACTGLRSITLHDFDLEKFQYIGRDIDFHLANLSKVKELDLGQVSVGLNNKVFSAIACVASTLEVLSLDVSRQAEDIERDAPGFPLLPNVKTLTLTLPTEVHDTITEFIEIGKKCPSLEIFKISLYWCASITKEKAWYTPFGFDFIRLKHVEISGYRGLMSDVQMALYMLGNASKIIIDPSCHPYDLCELTERQVMKIEEAGRSHAKSELSSCVFPQVELVIL